MEKVKNPFKYGSAVEGEYYFPLPAFSKNVRAYLDNRINVVLYGPRRFGKTSFLLDLMKEQSREGKACLLIDIFNITSHKDFLRQVLRAIKSKQNFGHKFKDALEKLAKLKLIPAMDVDPSTGQPSFSIQTDFSSEKDIRELIQDAFMAIGKLDDSVLVIIDEFQKVSQIEDGGWLEGTIRQQMQELKNTVFLFSGSRKSIIYDMLNNQSGPFYKTCQAVDIPILGDDFTDWVMDRFNTIGISCDKRAITELRKRVHNTPNYIQQVCFHLIAENPEIKHVNLESIEQILHKIVKQNAYAFETLLNSLTTLQGRVLRLCANEPTAIYSQELIQRYEINSGPALATSIKSLKSKGILESSSSKGQVIFDDPLFQIWLQKECS